MLKGNFENHALHHFMISMIKDDKFSYSIYSIRTALNA